MESVETVMDSSELQEVKHTIRKRKLKKTLIRVGVFVAIFMMAVLGALIYGRNAAKNEAQEEIERLRNEIITKEKEYAELIDTPIVVSPIAPEINLDIINSEIREIGELATVEYLFTDAAKFSDSKQIKDWNIPFTEKSFIMKWDGVIKAGVLVNEIDVSVNQVEKRITVMMPVAEILSYTINSDSVEVLDENDNIFNNISVTDKIKMDAKTEEAMKRRAIENGILEKARKNAETVISGLLITNPAIGNNYEIEFVEG